MAKSKGRDAPEDMDETPAPNAERVSATFLKVEQNGQTIYIGTLRIGDLYPCTFADPYEATDDAPGGGFQRLLDAKRCEEIAAYVSDGEGSVPNSVVLFATKHADLAFDRKNKTLSFKRHPKALLCGDGQHRVGGFHIAAEKHSTPHRVIVSIYAPLEPRLQAKLFSDINTKAKPLPAALILRVKELAATESEREAMLRGLFDRLGADDESPLRGLTSAARAQRDHLNSVAFNRAMGPVYRAKTWAALDADARYKVLRNYLAAWAAQGAKVAPSVDHRATLARSTYFAAVCEVFPDVYQAVHARTPGRFKPEQFAPIVGPLVAFDPAPHGRAATKAQLVESMRAALRGDDAASAPQAIEA